MPEGVAHWKERNAELEALKQRFQEWEKTHPEKKKGESMPTKKEETTTNIFDMSKPLEGEVPIKPNLASPEDFIAQPENARELSKRQRRSRGLANDVTVVTKTIVTIHAARPRPDGDIVRYDCGNGLVIPWKVGQTLADAIRASVQAAPAERHVEEL